MGRQVMREGDSPSTLHPGSLLVHHGSENRVKNTDLMFCVDLSAAVVTVTGRRSLIGQITAMSPLSLRNIKRTNECFQFPPDKSSG